MPTKNQKADPTQTDEYLITNQQFSSATEFSQHIERRASLGQNYIDVLTDYCVRNEVEIESVKKLFKKYMVQMAVKSAIRFRN